MEVNGGHGASVRFGVPGWREGSETLRIHTPRPQRSREPESVAVFGIGDTLVISSWRALSRGQKLYLQPSLTC